MSLRLDPFWGLSSLSHPMSPLAHAKTSITLPLFPNEGGSRCPKGISFCCLRVAPLKPRKTQFLPATLTDSERVGLLDNFWLAADAPHQKDSHYTCNILPHLSDFSQNYETAPKLSACNCTIVCFTLSVFGVST